MAKRAQQRERVVPHIFFHPDSDRRPRHLTGSADPDMQAHIGRSRAHGRKTHCPHTAGGEFHPALKTYYTDKGVGRRHATATNCNASTLLTGRARLSSHHDAPACRVRANPDFAR